MGEDQRSGGRRSEIRWDSDSSSGWFSVALISWRVLASFSGGCERCVAQVGDDERCAADLRGGGCDRFAGEDFVERATSRVSPSSMFLGSSASLNIGSRLSRSRVLRTRLPWRARRRRAVCPVGTRDVVSGTDWPDNRSPIQRPSSSVPTPLDDAHAVQVHLRVVFELVAFCRGRGDLNRTIERVHLFAVDHAG